MKFELAKNDLGSETTPNFSVVIAYDTPDAARRAMRLVDGIVKEYGRELNVHRNLWRFDVLSLPSIRDAAITEAALADLVIVSVNGDAELPLSVNAWLDGWAGGGIPGTAALVALLASHSPATDSPSPTRRFLQATAKNAGQEFFAHEFRMPSPTTDSSIEGIRQRAENTSSVRPGNLERSRPSSRWGLNE